MKFKCLILILMIVLSIFYEFSCSTNRLNSKLKSKSKSKSRSHLKAKSRMRSKSRMRMKHKMRMRSQRKLFEQLEHQDFRETPSLDHHGDSSIASQAGFELPEDLTIMENKHRIRMKDLPYDVEMSKIDLDLSDWLTISSASYANTKTYPDIADHYIHLDKNFTRINDKFISPFTTNGVPTPTSFWFKLNLKYVYYFETKDCINALGRIYLDEVLDVRDLPSDYGCFSVIEREKNVSYKICAETDFIKKKWLCRLQEICKVNKSKVCGGKRDDAVDHPKFKIKNVIQPMILIPMAAEKCNENWNYLKNGADWQCKCREGDNQSPIDLPPVSKAISTPASPLFEYLPVQVEAESSSHDGLVKKGQNHKIYFRNGALRIYAESFGKIVTLDGAGYYADEIVFHTPSEHKINGKVLDMEMKIIHKAKTEGDFGKTLTLSFLFKRKAGAYNKFIDNLDFYNLPNPYEKVQDLRQEIFIPNIFLDDDIDGSGEMQPFSFYSYEGSTTEPPCNENTLVYVASEPINISYATVELFREALKLPDFMDQNGRIINTSRNINRTNRRRVQQLKGRAVFHYDKKYDCNFPYKHRYPKYRKGHYERVNKKAIQYYFVDGEKPSMMPGAYVVTDNEAIGHMDKDEMESSYEV